MPQSGRGQIEAGLAIRECSDNAGTASNLAHDALQRVVGFEFDPMAIREAVIGQGLVAVLFQQLSRLHQLSWRADRR